MTESPPTQKGQTMTSVPDEALLAALNAAKADSEIAAAAGRGAGVFSVLPSIVRVALEAVGPLLVAAYLEEIVKPQYADVWIDPRSFTYIAASRALRKRAAELRGEAKP